MSIFVITNLKIVGHIRENLIMYFLFEHLHIFVMLMESRIVMYKSGSTTASLLSVQTTF